MNPPVPSSTASRRAAASPRRRDMLAAAAVAVAVVGFLLYAVGSLSRESRSAGGVEGVIVAKKFVPAPETQITFGSGGLHSREVAGRCEFVVRVPEENNHVYTVLVDPTVYAAHGQGDHFYFVRPRPETRLNTHAASSVPP